MKKYYCPKCGHEFDEPEVGGYDVPNGPGSTMFFEEFCPNCKWMGFKKRRKKKV